MKLNTEQITKIQSHKKALTGERSKPVFMAGGLFPKGALSFLASPPGVGKTWFTLLFATSASKGLTITGEDINPQKSVILVGEAGIDLMNNRLSETNWEWNADFISMYSAVDLSLDNIKLDIATEEGRAIFLQIIQEENPDVIIFDTLISFHSFDESKQQEMSRIYLYLLKIAKAFDIAIVCNHHTRKRSQNNPTRSLTQDDLIGTSAAIRLAHTVYILDNDDSDDDESTCMILRSAKSWNKKIPPISIKLVEDNWGKTTAVIRQQAQNERSVAKNILASVLCYGYKGSLFKPDEMAVKYGVQEKTVRKYLRKYCEVDDKGIKVLKEVTVDNIVLFAGNLTPKQLSEWAADNNYPMPHWSHRSTIYSPTEFLDFEH